MQWEVGVIKLTAKPASVLANKPQLREKTGNCLTHYGIEGIIAPAFAGLAKIGESGAYVLPQKTNSTTETERKHEKAKPAKRESDCLGVVFGAGNRGAPRGARAQKQTNMARERPTETGRVGKFQTRVRLQTGSHLL